MADPIVTTIQNTISQFQELGERLDAQLAFAQELCNLQRPRAAVMEKLLVRARAMASEIRGFSNIRDLRQGVEKVEMLLAPLGKLAKQYTLYCVGHAHIDMNWMWGWPETVAVTNDTFATVLKLMDEFPQFCFSQSQASIYAIIERHNPEMLKRIAQRVKEGRWEVTASHWVEGDRNMVSGESLTRHLLHTRRYMQDLFGLTPEDVPIDWSPDTFGHPASVPMYLSRGGVKWVYLHRPGCLGPTRPGQFWWKLPDGARVLVRNDVGNGYNGAFTPDVWKQLARDCAESRLKFSMFVYGVGDHGGGPTRRDLGRALDMNTWPIFPNITLGRASDYYARLEAEGSRLPVVDCELNTELTGCYTTQSLIKRSNRIAENRLTDAETFCTVVNAVTGRPYPKADFVEAWRDTMFSHFHDILPGSNVHDSRTYMHGMFQKTMATTTMIETLALREMAAAVNTTGPGAPLEFPPATAAETVLGGGAGYGSRQNTADAAEQTSCGGDRPFVIFNPTAWERREIVEATVWWNSQDPGVSREIRGRQYAVRTPDGKIIPAQKVDTGAYWGHAFARIVFPATIPPLGYAAYTVLEQPCDAAEKLAGQTTPPHYCSYLIHERRAEGIENDLLRLELDPVTGGIRRLLDKRSGLALIERNGDAPILEYLVEKPHAMTAWLIDNICHRQTPKVVAINRKLDGPYKATLEVQLKIEQSDLTVTYDLCAGDPRLLIHITGTWFQRGTPETGVPSLRLGLPLALSNARATYEIPFGAITRDVNHNEEVPAVNWAMVQGKTKSRSAGLLLANDCKHGHSLDGSTLHLSLIRAAYDPDPLPEITQHEIHLALCPFAGEMDIASAIRTGRALNRPLRVVGTSVHAGTLKLTGSAARVENAALILADLKQAEDGADVIVRLLNPTAKSQKALVHLDSTCLGKFSRAREVDLMERPITGSTARLTRDKCTLTVPAHAIASVRLAR